jgi:hypothetical protein
VVPDLGADAGVCKGPDPLPSGGSATTLGASAARVPA